MYLNSANPLAVVEAKDNNHSISFGMQQAKLYAEMLDVKFAYSSNGDGFQEFDFLTGVEREISLEEFPTPDELYARYNAEINDGSGLSKTELSFINQPFYTSQTTYPPRYYQRNAVNRTLDAIAKGKNRLLLVMATGTGKTYTAFQIVYRLLQTGAKQKILYLADRNNLIDQTIGGDFKPLEKVIHKINFLKDDRTTIASYQVYFSLYQQLAGNKKEEDDESDEEVLARYSKLFDKDFFDLIIVDECHRGSAKENSRWRKILEYFSSATQIGMTATPKETQSISNIDYFGEPVYIYSLKEGIADGFLAPFKVINVKSDIGDGWRPRKGQVDIYGYEIEDRIYNNSDFDYKIIIKDRIDMVAREVTNYLKATDRMAKTIVFCATEDAAERMRFALTKCNADMIAKNPDYVVRITGSDDYGNRLTIQRIAKHREADNFSCATYRKKKKGLCSSHRILVSELTEVVKSDLQKVCEYVFLHEKEFTDEYLSGSKKETEKFQSKTKSEIKRLSDRQEEIGKIIRKLYEDNVSGRITDERFDFLAKSYEDEGNDLKQKTIELQNALSASVQDEEKLSKFLKIVKAYTEIQELTPEILNSFIEKIYIGETKRYDGRKMQEVEIIYKFVGAINLPQYGSD